MFSQGKNNIMNTIHFKIVYSISIVILISLMIPHTQLLLDYTLIGHSSTGDPAISTRAASVPVWDISMSWTYDYEFENEMGTTFQGTENLAVEAIQDLNLGGFEYEAYRISLSGTGVFDTGDNTGSTSVSGKIFLRTADLACIKTEKETISEVDGTPTTRKEEITETFQPPRMDFKFPLEKSKSWTSDTHCARHITETIDDDPPTTDTQEEDLSYRYWVQDEENITVDAGTFFTYSIRRSNVDNLQNYTQYWFSPQVAYIIKEEEWKPGGGRAPVMMGERELTDWARNEPPEGAASIEDLTMQEDISDESIDLNDVFNDPNGDPLTFSFDDPAHLSVSIVSGKVTLSAPLNWYGNDAVTFSASDGISETNATATVNITVLSVNDPPILKDGQVTPSSGTSDTVFSYSVGYSDIEGDAPTSASVFIVDVDEYSMEIPEIADWKEEVTLELSINLSPGTHQFYFSATDGDDISRFPVSGVLGGPDVEPDNYPPVLSGGIVVPEVGDTSTEFTFEVDYRDDDGDSAEFCKVFIDDYEYPMNQGDGTWENGTKFTFTATLVEGSHTYYFECGDGDTSVRLPAAGTFKGPMVEVVENHAPRLRKWKVEPENGDEDDQFIFSINYLDDNDDEPVLSNIVIDGKEYDMTAENDDFSEGVIYTFPIYLEAGDHSFYFRFSDGAEEARYPANSELSIHVDEKPGKDKTVSSGSWNNTTTILIMIGIVVAIAVLWLLLGRKRNGEEFAEVVEVSPMEDDMEWD